MKAFLAVLLLVFLASCGEEAVVETPNPTPVEQVSEEIEEAIAELPEDVVDMVEENAEKAEVTPEVETSEEEAAEETTEETIEEVEAPVEEAKVEEVVETVAEPVETEEVVEEAKVEAAVPKVVELSTTYTNPKMEAVMNINYSMDADNKISEITVTSPNYSGMNKFNDGIQVVVGMTIDEALEQHVSGSSLATAAFREVLKG